MHIHTCYQIVLYPWLSLLSLSNCWACHRFDEIVCQHYVAYHITKVKIVATRAHAGNQLGYTHSRDRMIVHFIPLSYECSSWPWQLESVSTKNVASSWQLGHVSMPCRLGHYLYKEYGSFRLCVSGNQRLSSWIHVDLEAISDLSPSFTKVTCMHHGTFPMYHMYR